VQVPTLHSPAGLGKGKAKHGPRPRKGSGEEEFTSRSYVLAAETHRRSGGPSRSCCYLPAGQPDGTGHRASTCCRASPTFSRG